MAELNLPACPICQARDSLSRQMRLVQDKSYVWYECLQCGSVLLQAGAYKWTYQKIGVASKSYLLKQPLSAAELQDMLPMVPPPAPEPEPARPEPVSKLAPQEELPAAARVPFKLEPEPAPEESDVTPIPEAPTAPPRAIPRYLVVAIIVLSLCLLISLVTLLLTVILNRPAAPTPETGSLIMAAVAMAGLGGTA